MRLTSHQRSAGFTLVELMVGIAILGILVLLATPSYRTWVANSRVRSTSESLQNGLRLARNQAVDLARPVRFELSSATSANWTICVPTASPGTCGGVSASCTASLRSGCVYQSFVNQSGSNGVSLGSTSGTGGSYGTALSGLGVSGVTFDAMGRPIGYNTTALGRVDVISSALNTRRLVNTVSPSGAIRECDANLPLTASTPQGCS